WITRTPKGAWLVVNLFDRGATAGLVASRSTDGKSFVHSVVVEGSTSLSFRNLAFPCVSPDSGRIYVAYFELFPTAKGELLLQWSDDDGVTWPAANLLTVTAADESMAFGQPMCATRGQDVWLTYGLSNTKNQIEEQALAFPVLSTIRLAHSSDAGV